MAVISESGRCFLIRFSFGPGHVEKDSNFMSRRKCFLLVSREYHDRRWIDLVGMLGNMHVGDMVPPLLHVDTHFWRFYLERCCFLSYCILG